VTKLNFSPTLLIFDPLSNSRFKSNRYWKRPTRKSEEDAREDNE